MPEITGPVCDECESVFVPERSAMKSMCAECSHLIFGYPACPHRMVDGRCELCGWNGRRSYFLHRRLDEPFVSEALGIPAAELAEQRWSVEPDNGSDGVLRGYSVNFDVEQCDPEFLARIKGLNEDGSVRIGIFPRR